MKRGDGRMDEDRKKKHDAAVKRERNRLRKIYAELPPKRLSVAMGLIDQAARMRVQLDELASDIAENGMTEWFQQSEKCEPYKRERPEAAIFVKLDKNYQTVMRQLADMVPAETESPEAVNDAFKLD